MNGRTIVVAGLAGVGKTTLVDRLIARHPDLLHVRAGQLLAMAAKQASPEALRSAPSGQIVSNQETLAVAFEALRSEQPDRTIVFDGHVLVDNDVELVQVPVQIFRRLRPVIMIFIEDSAEAIAARREDDTQRHRPRRTALQLEDQQSKARALTEAYAQQLGVPFERVRSGDIDQLEIRLGGLI